MPGKPILLAALAAAPLLLAPIPAAAEDVWHATRLLLPGDTLRADDVFAKPPARALPDAIPATRPVTGLEVKRRIYANRPLTTRDVGPRAAVRANTAVEVLWKTGNLTLQLDGRALESGAVGDEIRVLNTTTSRTIRGTITAEGVVEVTALP
jgi:flagella basal body P-ring formation protein FlgA